MTKLKCPLRDSEISNITREPIFPPNLWKQMTGTFYNSANLWIFKLIEASTISLYHTIDSLWPPSLDSRHHPTIYWEKSTEWVHSSVLDMGSQFDYKHRCLIEKNVPMALILPSRWKDGAESLGIECTSCLWPYLANTNKWCGFHSHKLFDVVCSRWLHFLKDRNFSISAETQVYRRFSSRLHLVWMNL